MSNLSQKLYITYSNQKQRALKQSVKALDKVITLDNLILEYYEKYNFNNIIDETIGSSIIYKIIQEHNIAYFDYLKYGANSIDIIYGFIVKCHRNDVDFSNIIDNEDKLNAIIIIDKYYQEFKQIHNLSDIADIEKIVLKTFDINYLSSYNEIFVDNFKVGDISFIKSKLQQYILDKFNNCKTIHINNHTKQAKIIKPSNDVFDNIDEVKTALKISRKLLEDDDGVSSDDILIVASDISEYSPLFNLYLDEYELKGYSSLGTKLSNYFNNNDTKVKIATSKLNQKISLMEQLYKSLDIPFSDSISQKIKDSITIQDDKIGIEITEPNQLVGLNKRYKHIIFIGTDINHFPPKAVDNFIFTYDDEIKYFYSNDYFLSSQTQLNELKEAAKNLYIVTASYSGKRELVPSILMPSKFDDIVNIDNINSKNDITLLNQTTLEDFDIDTYTNIEVKGLDASHLSASQINKYQSCPLSYLYSNKIRLQAPAQDEEGFDVMEQGSLMHLCYELFGVYIKKHTIISVDKDELYNIMYNISIEAYNHDDTTKDRGDENIHHQIFLSNLQAGLKDDRVKGLLAKFVDYYILNSNNFNYFKDTEFEKEFLLDENLSPTTNSDNYFIKGFIDRFDNLENTINIIDYKSKKVKNKDKKKQEEVDDLKDVQLALYMLYASQEYPNKQYESYLLSFKGNDLGAKFATLSNTDTYNEEYENRLKSIIFDTKQNIENGKFNFDNSDETMCGWCDMRFICHESLFERKVGDENE